MIDSVKHLALETLQNNKQAIIFLPSRASAEKTAEELSKLTSFNYLDLEKRVLKAVPTPTKQCKRLSLCIRKGIVFHHAGLVNEQKELIEDEFKEGKIRIICATPTLAAGLSLPVFRVIIKSLKRYSGSWGMDWIPVLEYLQMAGRAGRPEYEKYGEAIVVAKDENEKKEIYQQYICGFPEEIFSKLAVEPVLRTYLLSLISSGIIRDEISRNEFFSKTFWAHHFKDMPALKNIIGRMIHLLEQWEFVKIINTKDDFVSASQLNQDLNLMKPTQLGKRVSELYLDPLTARYLLDGLQKYSEKSKEFSLLHLISHTLEMRPLLRTSSKENDKIQEELIKRYELLLEEEPSAFDLDYSEFIDSVKTSLFFEAWINEKDEDYLLEVYGIRPGEIKVKLDAAEWLLYSCEELAKICSMNKAEKDIKRLRIRMRYGIKEELLALIKLKNIGRMRARKLYSNGIKDLGGLKKIDIASLGQILGKNIAEDIKQQLGEEVKEVPKGKRVGQLSIEKFDG